MAERNEPIISFRDFSFQYRAQKRPTLTGIDLDIYPGERVLIAGPSGSGKSTLAGCINKQANIDSLNGMFSENASTLGITYIDVATVFKDGSGYFGSSYTDSGYNLKSGYYAFMLNGIAGVK